MIFVLDTCTLIWWSLDPEKLWLESVALQWNHKDPADRVIVSLAQRYNADLITSDTIIRGFYSSVIW
jgi:PIN domain nuclease of toxin-antitoxin system